MFKKVFQKRPQDLYADSEVPRESVSTHEHEKGPGDVVDTPIPLLTWRSFIMGIFVSMGGFLFGYDTGQISGFLEMPNFLLRYGQLQPDGTYTFSHVRSGLIVALVSVVSAVNSCSHSNKSVVVYWYTDGSFDRCPNCRSRGTEMVY
jgi:SP family sugar:H+ symporter-like MFS transporter